jgi:hypothetical protein
VAAGLHDERENDRRNGQTHSQIIWMIGTLSRPVVQEAWETFLRAWQTTDDQATAAWRALIPSSL